MGTFPVLLDGFKFQPTMHLYCSQSKAHLRGITDGLPKFKDLPTELGGTGEFAVGKWQREWSNSPARCASPVPKWAHISSQTPRQSSCTMPLQQTCNASMHSALHMFCCVSRCLKSTHESILQKFWLVWKVCDVWIVTPQLHHTIPCNSYTKAHCHTSNLHWTQLHFLVPAVQ